MQLGMIGLGRMGANMVRRLLRGGHQCVVFDVNADSIRQLVNEGATGATSLDDLARRLDRPRAAWVMVPAGEPTEQAIAALSQQMDADDIIIDGGNSYYKDDVRRAKALKQRGIQYVDVGTSGGIWGVERGYCLMIGGEAHAVARLEPIFTTLAPGPGDIPHTLGRETHGGTTAEGYLHCGPSGAGHFVKMIHNSIEYGLM
ncbi:MAG: NADP-dependent phosphogluconate dehydrogenase, partial [candidate division NC10 bacterium]|nr:NADP-dependent phosphogluconate dehydrogenase [candidate division NC10 bacterium]